MGGVVPPPRGLPYALISNTVEPIPTLGALSPRGGPVQGTVLTRGGIAQGFVASSFSLLVFTRKLVVTPSISLRKLTDLLLNPGGLTQGYVAGTRSERNMLSLPCFLRRGVSLGCIGLNSSLKDLKEWGHYAGLCGGRSLARSPTVLRCFPRHLTP